MSNIYNAATELPPSPCDFCNYWDLCKAKKLACKACLSYTNARKFKFSIEKNPTRDLYNQIYCDIVPYNEDVHGE